MFDPAQAVVGLAVRQVAHIDHTSSLGAIRRFSRSRNNDVGSLTTSQQQKTYKWALDARPNTGTHRRHESTESKGMKKMKEIKIMKKQKRSSARNAISR